MKVLLTIGHYDILLPDDAGVSTVLKALSRGLECVDRLYDGKITVSEPVRIGMKYVPPKTRILGMKTKAEREVLCLEEPKAIIPTTEEA